MASIRFVSGSIRRFPDFPAEGRVGAFRDAAAKMFYFTSIAILFAFVLILSTGTQPY